MAKRGFKAWCERIAEQYRTKFGLEKTAPLPAMRMAAHMNVTVWNPKDIPGLDPEVCDHLLGQAASNWSAATLSYNGRYLIVLNSQHSDGRQSNDLMHELSHLICDHDPARVDISEDGILLLKSYNPEQEEEADLLASTLLLPRVALVKIKNEGVSISDAAGHFGVSTALLEMRLNVTGVNHQFKHRRRKAMEGAK